MAHCWHRGTCLSAIFTGWLLALLVPLIPALPSTSLDTLAGNSTSLAIPFSLPAPDIPTVIAWDKDLIILATGNFRPNFSVLVAKPYRPRFHVDPTSGSLNITALIPDDAGVYTVSLRPLGGTEQKANITLRVYEEVHDVSVNPSAAVAYEGDISVTFTCSPDLGSVTWTKDGQSLGEDPRFQLSGGSLKINYPQRTDAGSYRCTVSNPFSSGTGMASLTVYYGPDTPTISISLSGPDSEAKDFVLVNTSLNLTCQAPSQPPADISWIMADNQDHTVPSTANLPLSSVQLNQAGTYSCLAFNERTNRRVRSTYRLTVAQRPTGSPSCSVASNESALLFVCSWPGGSPDPRLSFRGLPEDKEVTSPRLEQLVVPPFPAGLSGRNITCLASHLTGEKSCSIVPEAPSGVILLFQAFEDAGGMVTMEMRCQGTFNPAEIAWFRSGELLVPAAGDRYELSPDGTRLTIWNFTAPQDLGNYSATCSNPLGSQSTNLTVIGPTISEWTLSRGPDPGSASISWTVPSESAATSFRIQMQGPRQGRSASEWETVQVLGAANRSTTVPGLEPTSSYSFQVVPLLGLQAGNPSQVLTLQAEPHLSAGAIAGIVIGSILGFLLLLLLLILLVFLVCRARKRKVPPTAEKQQHYLSRQFPHGRESNEPSWGNPRWSSGDSDIYAITYEEHLRRHGGPATLPFDTQDGRHRSSAAPRPQPTTRHVRSATRV